MEITWFYHISILVALYIITTQIISRLKLQKGPPSPFPCLPLIGHLHILSKHPITQVLKELADKYGPIIMLRFGSRPNLLVTSAAAAEECLSGRNDATFGNRPSSTLVGKILGYDFTTINFGPYDGSHWRKLRRIANLELLSAQRLDSLAEFRADEVKLLIKELNKKAPQNDNVVDMKLHIFHMTLNVMLRMILGIRYDTPEDEGGKKLRNMVTGTVEWLNTDNPGDHIICLKWWFDRKLEGKMRKFKEERELLLRELIEEHRIGWDSQNGSMKNVNIDDCNVKRVKPMVQVLLELQQSDPHFYTYDVIFGIILDLLVGGSDTIAGTMEWTLSVLLNHLEILKKAQKEIDNYVGYDRFLDESDLEQLPYLQGILNETLRMYPTNPLLAPHESSQDCVVGGYRIPRGTMLMINLLAIQNDPNNWEDPTSFKPERFEGLKGHKVGFKMMPFGSGRRSCPGEALAMRVIGLTIGSLIQCFEWERVDENLVDMSTAPAFNLQRAQPLKARLRPRAVLIKFFGNISS